MVYLYTFRKVPLVDAGTYCCVSGSSIAIGAVCSQYYWYTCFTKRLQCWHRVVLPDIILSARNVPHHDILRIIRGFKVDCILGYPGWPQP